MSKQPAPTASAVGPCPTVIKIVGRPSTGSLPSTIVPPDHPHPDWDCKFSFNDNPSVFPFSFGCVNISFYFFFNHINGCVFVIKCCFIVSKWNMVFPNVLVNVHYANGHIRGSERTCTGVRGRGGEGSNTFRCFRLWHMSLAHLFPSRKTKQTAISKNYSQTFIVGVLHLD